MTENDVPDAAIDTWVSVAMEEYNTLRAESLQAQRQQQEIVRVGLSAIALLVTLLNIVKADDDLQIGILTIVIPFLAAGSMITFLGELKRMTRAGNYLAKREEAINSVVAARTKSLTTHDGVDSFRRAPLGWERWLSRGEPRLISMYLATLALLGLLGAASEAYGLTKLSSVSETSFPTWIAVTGAIAFFLAVGVFIGRDLWIIRRLGSPPAVVLSITYHRGRSRSTASPTHSDGRDSDSA